jgi:hypothetical protein
MSAKFVAQVEISKPCVNSAGRPAEATSPGIVSSSGSPAAASEPNASTRIASVSGQENSSDLIIALRLVVSKSLHIPEAPVSETRTPLAPEPGGIEEGGAALAAAYGLPNRGFAVVGLQSGADAASWRLDDDSRSHGQLNGRESS